MPPFLPLFARRASDPPRYRVARILPTPEPGHTAYSPIERGASLIAEPLAWRTQRAGDVPTDLITASVPLEERYPTAGLEQPLADAEALAHVRAAVTTAITQGAPEDPATEDRLRDFLGRLDSGAVRNPADAVQELTEHLDYMSQAPERGIGTEALSALEEPAGELATLGWRAPLELILEELAPEPDSGGE